MKMSITVEDNGLGKLFEQLSNPHAKEDAKAELRSTSLAVMGGIKQDMPVDSGRARASWGIWSPDALTGGDTNASEADAHFEVTDDGTTISQGSNVPYIKELNDGSSTQAPAGFIDNWAKKGQDMLLKAVNALVDKWVGK